jgi:serine/threonine protein kinase
MLAVVQELAAGLTLTQLMHERRCLDEEQVMFIARSLLETLSYLASRTCAPTLSLPCCSLPDYAWQVQAVMWPTK